MGVIDVSSDTWEGDILKSQDPVVVDFWHEQCVWCKRLDPDYQALSEEFEGKVTFAKLNVLESHENQQISFQNGVMGTPTLKFYCGGRAVGELVGYAPRTRLKAGIQDMLNNNEKCLEQSTPIRLSPYG
ncbi:MAG: thioredoxin family protein [Candidatus Geothermarchaeales archaeon]